MTISYSDINTIYCIGRNYSEHAIELNNPILDTPVVFLKPNASIKDGSTIVLPKQLGAIHYEVELVLLIGDIVYHSNKSKITPTISTDSVRAIAAGIDLTARDIQTVAKQKGLPWTLAKGFKGATVIGQWQQLPADKTYRLQLWLNDELKQDDTTAKMIYDVPYLLNYLHSHFGLKKGDVIFTGTPKGVGELHTGDKVRIALDDNSDTYIVS